MEIGFNDNYWRRPASALAHSAGLGGEFGVVPEWLELRARLAAAWSTRRELAECGDIERSGAAVGNAGGDRVAGELVQPRDDAGSRDLHDLVLVAIDDKERAVTDDHRVGVTTGLDVLLFATTQNLNGDFLASIFANELLEI